MLASHEGAFGTAQQRGEPAAQIAAAQIAAPQLELSQAGHAPRRPADLPFHVAAAIEAETISRQSFNVSGQT
jgi:hypothetical protein